ncbi:MAG: HAMP domain-containing histidine kinase [Pirellulales bacterium]|nr:HAMP domain-containing histidine kinase [Pirellulales bacterium]
MGLLPCLRRGSDRWWLPRSPLATEAIGQALLAYGRNTPDPNVEQQLVAAVGNDPPLLIYAALSWPADRANPEELAQWLIKHLASRFASGDAFLGAPPIDRGAQQRWNQLRDHYRTVPFSKWLQDASLWLEVTGPPVPAAWKEQWPELISGLHQSLPTNTSTSQQCMLQQLARLIQRQRVWERSFDDRLHQSKLGALKQLAYGLSHEINNPLANISTRAQQLQRDETDPHRAATLQRIVDQVYRAHQMIADLMFFANPPAANPQPCDLAATLREVVDDFADQARRQAIRLETQISAQPAASVVDEKMIGEALRTLIQNSLDAIGSQGTIIVSLVRHPDQWMIHVADSGPGLSDQARRHAFDPYYSGREAGRGLGLGLCRAYRIAELHRGEVTLAGGPAGCVATITLNAAG